MNGKSVSFSGMGIRKLLYLLIIVNLSSSIDILIVQNDKNKNSQIWFEEIKKQFDSDIDFHQCNYSEVPEYLNTNSMISIIFDISNDFDIQLSLSQLCRENRRIHLVAQKMYEFNYYDEWTYSIIPSNPVQMEAYFAVLDYFNWTQGLVISDKDNINTKQEFLDSSNQFDYLTIESSANIENLVSRIIKPLGTTLYYIFANSVVSLKIQELLFSKKLLLNGDGIILNQNSGYNCTIDGAMIITVAGQEYTTSQEDYLFHSTQILLQYLINSTTEPLTVESLRYLLKKYSEQHQFSIVNIRSSKREIVGSISNGIVTIFKTITFPGNSNDVPRSDKKILYLTVTAGSYNPGTPPATYILPFYYGAYTAWKIINEGELGILKNFQTKHFIFDCGALNYDEAYATACFTKDIDKFGLVHMSAISSLMAIGELKVFKALNLTIPVVGAVARDDSLSSTELYPLFTRTSISIRYTLTLASLLFKALGWNKACVLYFNDTTCRLQYSTFIKSAEQYDLEILNPESSRMIIASSNRTNAKKYSNQLQTIIDTQARLLVLLIQPPEIYYILEELYDLGLRKGDLFTFTLSPLFLTMVSYDFMYTYKIKETGVPMIEIDAQNWVGTVGKFAYSKIASTYNTVPSSYACLTYDAAYFIAIALDSMINQGLDYYDPQQTNLALRAQKFIGCTGTVSIDRNSNDRIIDTFDISSNKIDITSGNVTAFKMGEFHPYSSKMLTIDSPIIYGDGTTTKPDDLRNQDNECPFPKKLIKTFVKGRIITFGICFGFALISLALTAFIWKRWWNITIRELKQRYEISMQDLIVELTIGVEFFQFASMGPDVTPISNFLGKIMNYSSLNFENILTFKNELFWIVYDWVLGAILLWLILCLIVLLRMDEKFPRFSIFRFFAWLANYLMPILGNLCFIPFVSVCLDIFVCDQSIGESLTESFLSQDCYYFCWKDEHLIYAIFSFIALLCYVPLAVFCRPLWQELQNNVHINAAPLFLMMKTVAQIIFVVVNKTVKRADSAIHGALFAFLMAIYIGIIFRLKTYNYPRLRWWQGLSLIGVLWLSVISTISSNVEGNYLIYFLFLCLGWIIIAFVGIYVQWKRYPSLLYRKKGLDTTNLYKFAFAFGKNSKTALSKIHPNLSSGDSTLKGFSCIKPVN